MRQGDGHLGWVVEVRLDPWGTTDIEDYDRLFELFGIEPIEPLVNRIPNPSRFIRRHVSFGHRDLGLILDAVEKGEPYAVMSGIKPTGIFHLGSKMTAENMIYFQSLSKKATVFYAIADVEAYRIVAEHFVEPNVSSATQAIAERGCHADGTAHIEQQRRLVVLPDSLENRRPPGDAAFRRGASVGALDLALRGCRTRDGEGYPHVPRRPRPRRCQPQPCRDNHHCP